MSYEPSIPPAQYDAKWMRAEQTKLQQADVGARDYLQLKVLHKAPARPRGGMLVIADGVDWKPDGVNGEGLYRRDKTNTNWVFIG